MNAISDMSAVIVPKSDQISADDFIAGPRTYAIDGVEIRPGTEQPVSIFLTGEPRAWKPCKSMSRCLVSAWGPDANVYIGRSLTLYRDPKVKWGGMEVGGIRVSHMSHIERDMLLQLTATKGKRTPHVVKPLADAPAPAPKQATEDRAARWADAYMAEVGGAQDRADLEMYVDGKASKLAELAEKRPELHTKCTEALQARRAEFAPEGKPAEDTCEAFSGADEPDF